MNLMKLMTLSNPIGRIFCGLLGAALLVGCSLYANDRAYLPDSQYALARRIYIQSGSLDLVKRQLEEMEWRRGKINEAIYRLQKEFEVLPEEIPALAQTAPQALPAPAATSVAPAPASTTAPLAAPQVTTNTATLPLPPPPAMPR